MHKQLLTCALLGCLLMSGTANAQTCTNTAMAESTPTSGFTFSGDGKTATNTATGLTWKRCLEGQTFSDNGTSSNYADDTCTGSATGLNWQAALNQAQTANGANSGAGDSGYNDWRVPNQKELKSIVEHCRVTPAINTDVFPGGNDWVWSSSPVTYPGYASDAWFVGFSYGYDGWNRRDGDGVDGVRLVRSGQ